MASETELAPSFDHEAGRMAQELREKVLAVAKVVVEARDPRNVESITIADASDAIVLAFSYGAVAQNVATALSGHGFEGVGMEGNLKVRVPKPTPKRQ